MSDIEFIDGLIFKAPNDKAPEYVKAKLSIKRADLIAWLNARDDEWINADVKVSQAGKWYAAVDDWKPESRRQEAPKAGGHGRRAHDPAEDPDDRTPFLTNRGMF